MVQNEIPAILALQVTPRSESELASFQGHGGHMGSTFSDIGDVVYV